MISPTPVSPSEQQRLAAAANWIETYVLRVAEHLLQMRDSAPPHSIVGRGAAVAKYGWSDDTALLKIQSSGDHLLAVARLLRGPVIPRVACYSLLRAAIEGDAQAAWLMAARQSHAVRVQRRFLERADSFKESIRMMGSRDPKHRARARTLVRRALRLGLIAARPKAAAHRATLLSELQSIARRRATMTSQIISLYGTSQVDGRPKGEFVYQLLSGLAHADTWANMMGAIPLRRIGPGHQLGELPLNIDRLLNCCMLGVQGHERMVRDYIEISRADLASWDSARGPIPTF